MQDDHNIICCDCYRKAKSKVAEHNLRARRAGSAATLKVFEWLSKVLESKGNCCYCNKKVGYSNLVVEHILPISSGGGNTKENVVPACFACNSSKGTRSLDDWNRFLVIRDLTKKLMDHLNLSERDTIALAICQLAAEEGLLEDEVQA